MDRLWSAFQLTVRRNLIQASILPVTNILGFGAVGVVLWLAARQVASGSMSGADLLAYLVYAGMMAGSLSQVASHVGKVKQSLGASERIMQLLSETPEPDQDGECPTVTSGQLRFSNVTFAYEGAHRPVVRGITADVAAGATVAVVGPSGSGKSTLANLITRIGQPQSGHIFLDGIDIATLPLQWLRQQVGIVPQEVFMFSGTIRENILFGNPAATEPEVLAAARAANLDEFVAQLPQQYDTFVGERGATLSRGQCQRIAIARMLLKNPAIVILDEATASLDSENERLVHEALKRLMIGRTTVVIAHHAAAVREADLILVLVAGEVVESGRHTELLQREGLYARLFAQVPEEWQ